MKKYTIIVKKSDRNFHYVYRAKGRTPADALMRLISQGEEFGPSLPHLRPNDELLATFEGWPNLLSVGGRTGHMADTTQP